MGLVLEDAQFQDKKESTTPELGRIEQLVVRRTQDWVKATVGKLSVLLKKIISCASSHQHWRVRLEMVELGDHLLAKCSQSLGECVGLLVEALVGAINDEEPRVKKRFEMFLILERGGRFNLKSRLISFLVDVRRLSERCQRGIGARAAEVSLSLMCCQRISTLWLHLYPD